MTDVELLALLALFWIILLTADASMDNKK